MTIRTLLLTAFAALLMIGLQGPSTAVADDAADARKAFRAAVRAEDWKLRKEAYFTIADYDSAEVVKEILTAMGREKNPAVLLTAIGVLGGLQSEGAQEELIRQFGKARGTRKLYVLLVLARQKGDLAVPVLLETVRGKDAPAMAQAALALGEKEVEEAVPDLVRLLRHKDWQVRRAGAMALRRLAQPPPPKPKKGEQPDPNFRWPVSDALKAPEVTQALVAVLGSSKGRDRRDALHALDAIHDKQFGDNVAAWKLFAQGKEVDERTLRKRKRPAHAYGIPLYGQRVVLIYDNSLRSGDPHAFGSDDRMLEVCEVPGSRPLLHMRLRTVGQFAQAHYKRAILDMPKGTKFELIHFNEIVHSVFGKFASAGTASRKVVEEVFTEMKNDNGIASYTALETALDTGGGTDAKAWKKGPDEIVFTTCNVPTHGEIKEADVVGAAIALKARLRMVPIHTVGIETHPYAMLETIARETGGVYRNYVK